MGVTQRLGTIPLAIQTDSSNNVGIGTSTIGGKLDVRAAATSAFSYYFRNAAGGYGGGVYNTGSNNTQLYLATSAGTENVLLNTSGASYFNGGNVGIGTSSPTALLTLAKDNVIGINTTDGADNGYLALAGAGGDGDNRGGHIYLSGNERGADAGTAIIAAGSVGSIQFRTGASVERMRITSGGYIGIGVSSLSGWGSSSAIQFASYGSISTGDDGARAFTAVGFNVYNSGGWTPRYIISGSTASVHRQRDGVHEFMTAGSGTAGNTISFTTAVSISGSDLYVANQGYKPGGGSWGNSSDIRLKENVKTIENALDKVMQLRGVTFDWKEGYTENGKKESGGFIADEVMEIFPDWVTETNATDAQKEIVNDDKIKSLSLPFSFDALLVEAIKELSAKVTALENK